MEKMNTVRLNAYAKLNLTLDITGTEGGYHTLDSLVTTVDLSDRVVVKKRKDSLVNVRMHGMGSEQILPEENNAVRAAEAFVSRFQTGGADITIYKNIPIGAGLGGSSADAAGAIKALAKLYAITDMVALKALADGFGSDTGYLLTGGFARMRGRGTEIDFLGELPKIWFLLLCPKSGVSTADCYRAFDETGKTFEPRTEKALELLRGGNLEWAARLFGNHLTEAATGLNGDVETALKEARSFSPLAAGMTGSGSAAYAAFDSEELCRWAKSRYRGKFRAYCVKSTCKQKTWHNPYILETEEG